MPDDRPDRLEIGRVGRPHGLQGEVTVLLVSDRDERTQPGAVLHAGERALVVEAARPYKQGWIVRFADVTDVDAAEALRGSVLTAPPLPPRDGELFADQLIGAEVLDLAGAPLGRVVAIEANPAHDLLVLDGGGLVPMPFVVEHSPGRIVVDPPAGLLDG
jgi:16S rRNA processing protein RimM